MHVILAAYRSDDLISAVKFVDSQFLAKPDSRRVLVVNQPDLFATLKNNVPNWELVQGTNEFGEFSAWQEGLAYLARSVDGQGILFANDTIDTHRHFSVWRAEALRRAIDGAGPSALVGFRDSIDGDLRVAGMPLHGWVSTYCFFLTGDALRRLQRRLLYPESVRACVRGGVDEVRFFDRLSPDLQSHLQTWLFGGRWYAGGPLTVENSPRMTRKAEAIISEKLLSATCQSLSIETVDPFVQHSNLARADRMWQRVCRSVKSRLLSGEPSVSVG